MISSYTEQMENALFEQWDEFDDYNEDYSALIEKLNNDDGFRTFGEGLLHFLQRKNPTIDSQSAIKYIDECCREANIPISDIASSNTLKNWFTGGPRPKKGENSRDSLFAFAFAVRLSSIETAELFHKVYLDRAFDYRNVNEVIYYFCLNNKKSWQDAKRMIDTATSITTYNEDHTIYTSAIKNDVELLKDENSLLDYIVRHGHNLSEKNITAKSILERLITEAKKRAKSESELDEYSDRFFGYDKTSNNFLYEVITDLKVSGEKGTVTLFKNSRLPKEIKNRFPEAVTLAKKEPTYEELRKLIIMLFSYCYWHDAKKSNELTQLDDYIEKMNVYLNESGFSLMYYGNPYDWMYMYCGLSERPLDTFRGLLSEVLYD